MLSIAKIAAAGVDYYAREASGAEHGYYVEQGGTVGTWLGSGLGELGLTAGARVEAESLEWLFAGHHPVTGVRLGKAFTASGIRGYDLTMSAPKSVSALMAIAPAGMREQVIAGHRAAVEAALTYVETHAAFSRMGAGGLLQVDTRGLAVAAYDHFTSRCGDPQLHTHCVVAAKVRCADGAWRALDGREVYTHARSAGMTYQAGLRVELTRRLGLTFTPVDEKGMAEIAGLPAGLSERWSSRRRDIERAAHAASLALEAQLGRPLTAAERRRQLEDATLATRPVKRLEPIGLRDLRWRAEAETLGHPISTVAPSLLSATQLPAREVDVLEEAGRERAVFTRAHVVEASATLVAAATAAAVSAQGARIVIEAHSEAALRTPEAVPLIPVTGEGHVRRDGLPADVQHSAARYATATGLATEQAILDRALRGRHTGVAELDGDLLDTFCREAGLSEDQTEAAYRIGGGGDAISVLESPAGSGKTSTLRPLTRTWQHDGFTVLGAAPSARAAEELGRSTGIPTATVARLLIDLEQRREHLTARTVLIVDEAGMLSRDDLDTLSRASTDAGAKLVLAGDSAQIPAVRTPGGMLTVLGDHLGRAQLTQVHRFTHDWERDASLQLRDRHPHALQPYLDHDRIHTAPTEQALLDQAFQHWQERSHAGADVLLLARNRGQVEELNDRARAAALTDGTVHGPAVQHGGQTWQAGDRLLATRNDSRLLMARADESTTPLRNGHRLTVTEASPAGLTVTSVDGELTGWLPAAYVAQHARRGWASTIDAGQGITVDETITVADTTLDPARLYVAMTRGRDRNDLYLNTDVESEFTHELRGGHLIQSSARRVDLVLTPTLQSKADDHLAGLSLAAHDRSRDHGQPQARQASSLDQPYFELSLRPDLSSGGLLP